MEIGDKITTRLYSKEKVVSGKIIDIHPEGGYYILELDEPYLSIDNKYINVIHRHESEVFTEAADEKE